MLFKTVLLALFASAAVASPLAKRQKPGDANILALAANLELLELALWNQGLKNYSDEFTSTFGDNYVPYIQLHRRQEQVHYQQVNGALQSLTGKSVKNCTYSFPTVYDAKSFNTAAQVITSAGEAAYLGSGANFSNPNYAAVAATILGVEARQNSLHRQFGGLLFYNGLINDTPLSPSQAYSLAAPMIKNCPSSNPPLAKSQGGPLSVFSPVNATSNGDGTASLKFKSGLGKGTAALIVYQLKTYRAELSSSGSGTAKISIPSSVNGTAFVLLSTASGTPFPVPDSTVKGIGALVVG